MPAPMTMTMKSPRPTPSQIWAVRNCCSGGWDAHLPHELFIRRLAAFGLERALEQGQENGDDDARLEAFSEADEEDWPVSGREYQKKADRLGTANTLTMLN